MNSLLPITQDRTTDEDTLAMPVSTQLPTVHGNFIITVWPDGKGCETVALSTPHIDPTSDILVRVHSECMTGDTFGSLRCDCGPQKDEALRLIAASGNGVLIYLRQEGRGIGLYEKMKTYRLQERGFDTHEANRLLGHVPDQREYSWTKKVLDEFGIHSISLLTNNPYKVSAIARLGFHVKALPIVIASNEHNRQYVETKRRKFQHYTTGNGRSYSYQVSRIDSPEQVEQIARFVHENVNDPLLYFRMGIALDAASLDDSKAIRTATSIVEKARTYDHFIPTFHFSFSTSNDPTADLSRIYDLLPLAKHIQLNDLSADHLHILENAARKFQVTFPLTDEAMHLVQDPAFIALVRQHNITILLDNSQGQGIAEEQSRLTARIDALLERGINAISLAGGFGPDNLDMFVAIRDYFKINFSIDAESGLRTSGQLDLTKVKIYLSSLLNSHKKDT